MTKHIHADLMLEYAKDALETDKPWLLWQYYILYTQGWCNCEGGHPSLDVLTKYRRKPKTISINGHEVPEPLRTAPATLSLYYQPVLGRKELYLGPLVWDGGPYDQQQLERGILHTTKEGAIEHALALISQTRRNNV